MTRDETARILALVTATIPTLTCPPETVDAWHALLGDLPYVTVRQATLRVLARQTGAWWPTPGAIRQEAWALQAQSRPSAEDAWRQVMAAVLRYGREKPHEALASLDPPVRAAVQALGPWAWTSLCTGEEHTMRQQFLRIYGAMAEAATQDAVLPPVLREAPARGLPDPGTRAPGPAGPVPLGVVLEVVRPRPGADAS
jgi:hypothetical protein